MIWIILSSIFVSAAFIGTYFETQNTWDATNAGGLVALACLIVLLIRSTRPPMSRRLRLTVLITAALAITGITIHWKVMYSMTHWQYDNLHLVHKVIFHGVALDRMKTKGLKTLEEFHTQQGSRKLTLGEVFRRGTKYINQDSSIIEIDVDGQVKMMAASVTDAEILLIAQATIRVDGEGPGFRNLDGSVGAIQDRLRITRKGLFYELQN